MTPGTVLEPGDIVQLNPDTVKNKAFAGCLAIVDEVKSSGAQLCIQQVGPFHGSVGQVTYYMAGWDEMELTHGEAVWRIE